MDSELGRKKLIPAELQLGLINMVGIQVGFAIIRVSFRYLPTKEHCNNFIMKEIAEAHRQVIEEEEQPRR